TALNCQAIRYTKSLFNELRFNLFYHTSGAIPRGVPEPILPTLSVAALPSMLKSAVILAVLGSIDSLLTSLIADDVTRTQHKSDRELVGQGIGNIVAGLFGGIPGAGATMRTVINVRAGGRTPISGALHALVLLALVLGLAPLAEGIPLAVLAAILLKVGWDIIDWDYLRRLRRAPHSGVFVMFTVLLLTVLVDLVTAVGVGIIMKSLISARQLSSHQLDQLRISASDDPAHLAEEERALLRGADGRILLLHFSGPFSFCSAKDLVRRLSSTGFDYPVVVFDFGNVPMVDTSVAMAINDTVAMAAEDGGDVIVSGLGGQAAELLVRFGALDPVPSENRHETRLDALRQATALVAAKDDGAAAEPA
ncbi:MAG: SulP family inorganic anion transporter, partial [Rhodospirillaceae bacterium]|nr:SulP family inorganic anion transporter [Rhodospirillaceae bacterium]